MMPKKKTRTIAEPKEEFTIEPEVAKNQTISQPRPSTVEDLDYSTDLDYEYEDEPDEELSDKESKISDNVNQK